MRVLRSRSFLEQRHRWVSSSVQSFLASSQATNSTQRNGSGLLVFWTAVALILCFHPQAFCQAVTSGRMDVSTPTSVIVAAGSARAWMLAGIGLMDQGRLFDAEQDFIRAIHASKTDGANVADQAAALDQLGSVYRLQGRLSLAITVRLRSLALYEQARDETGTTLARSNLAAVYFDEGKLRSGRVHLALAMEGQGHAAGLTLDDRAAIVALSGWENMARKSYDDAVSAYESSLRLVKEAHGSDSAQTAWAEALLAAALLKADRKSHALELIRKAVQTLSLVTPDDPSHLARAELIYSCCLDAVGDHPQAVAYRQTALSRLRSATERSGCRNCTVDVEALR